MMDFKDYMEIEEGFEKLSATAIVYRIKTLRAKVRRESHMRKKIDLVSDIVYYQGLLLCVNGEGCGKV